MKDAPRILIIPSWYPPDGGHFFQDQAEALALQGFQVDVMVNRLVGLTRLRYSERNTLKRFSVSSLNGTRLIRSWQLKLPYLEMLNMRRWTLSTLRLFAKYSSRFGAPDLLLAHSSIWAGYSAAQISEETGIPYLLVEHRSRFTLPQEKVTQYLKPEYRPFLEKAFGKARQIITVSDALQPMILNYTDFTYPLI